MSSTAIRTTRRAMYSTSSPPSIIRVVSYSAENLVERVVDDPRKIHAELVAVREQRTLDAPAVEDRAVAAEILDVSLAFLLEQRIAHGDQGSVARLQQGVDHGNDLLPGRLVLHHETVRAIAERGIAVFGKIVTGDDADDRIGKNRLDGPGEIEAVALRQPDIHEDQVVMPGQRLVQRIHAVRGLGDPHEGEPPAQRLMERLAVGRVVFGDKDIDHHRPDRHH